MAISYRSRNYICMSPVTEQQIGTIPAATREDIERTLVSCQQAGLEWRKTSAWSRAAILRHTADLIRSRIDEIAKIMSTETGKPLIEAKAEAGASADQFEWYSEEGKRAYGQIIPSRLPDERLSVVYQPVGPCLALSAWNFPLLLPARKIARCACCWLSSHFTSCLGSTRFLFCSRSSFD